MLDELGLPWIPGYRPKPNYQNAIFDAIDRYLSVHAGILEVSPASELSHPFSSDIFVSAPERKTKREASGRLAQLIAKFDPVERDRRNRSLRLAGEEFVLDVERRRLEEQFRSDLARKVRWTSREDGDGAGFDISSFTETGRDRLIEVKTTNGSASTPFFLTRNECEVARQRPLEWMIYRVHLFAKQPRIFVIEPPLDKALTLSPETWRASF